MPERVPDNPQQRRAEPGQHREQQASRRAVVPAVGAALRAAAGRIIITLLVGVLAGIVVLVGGFALVLRPSESTITSASTVVLPARTLDAGTQVAYYEVLGQGTVVASFAEVLRQPRFREAALAALDGGSAPERVTTEVAVVPDTAVVRLDVVGPSETVTEAVAAGMRDRWRAEIASTAPSYGLVDIGAESGLVEAPPVVLLVRSALVLALALVLGAVAAIVTARGVGLPLSWLRPVLRALWHPADPPAGDGQLTPEQQVRDLGALRGAAPGDPTGARRQGRG